MILLKVFLRPAAHPYMKRLKHLYYFLKVIYQQRYVVWKLVARDFQKKYLATYIGLPWAFLQPMAMIAVIWFVVSIGLRGTGAVGQAPYMPWLVSGLVPWFFLRDAIGDGAQSLLDFSFLIKKTYFRVGVIPVVKIATALLIHLFLAAMMLAIVAFYGYTPDRYWLQLPYYLLCGLALVTGLGWLCSALVVFARDVRKLIDVALLLLFWITPVIWPATRLEGRGALQLVARLNPLHYVIDGYRRALIDDRWFWDDPLSALYFWAVALGLLVAGALVFTRLKPHFADVL